MQHSFPRKKPGRQSARVSIANFAIILSSLVIGLLLIELGIRLFVPQPMNGTVLEYAPRGYNVVRSKGTALFSVGDSKGIYHFLSPHLRGLRQPPAGAERILAIGDSFTFGQGLPEEDTYVASLQRKIDSVFGTDRIALLNAGIPGSGTGDQLAFLEDFGDEIAPRAVLVFVSVDDFDRAQRSPLYRLRGADTLELDEGTVPTKKLKRLVIGSGIYNFAIQHIQIGQLIRQAVIRVEFPNSALGSPAVEEYIASDRPTSPDQQRLVRALFRRMKAWCDSRGIKLAVINNGWHVYDWLQGLLASESVVSFDAAPQVQSVIMRAPTTYVIQGDHHPNAKGAAITAEAVWPFLETFIKGNKLY
jgi:lysophospholipase L1-like esterase